MNSQKPPPSHHREVVEAFNTVLLNRHRHSEHHPAFRLHGGDAQRFIGRNPRQPTHILDIRGSQILIGWRPLVDNRSDGKEPIFMVIGTRKQIEGRPPTSEITRTFALMFMI